MLTITFLEGYAGLRLRDGKPITVSNGLNLLVGKNGSGKSNLALLINYIYSKQAPAKRLFELPYLKNLGKAALKRYEARPRQPHDGPNIIHSDFGENYFCKFILNNMEGTLSLILHETKEYSTFDSILSDIAFNANGFAVKSSIEGQLKTLEIKPKIDLNNDGIYLVQNFTLFNTNNGNNSSANPIIQSILNNFNNFFSERMKEFHLHDEKLHKKIQELSEDLLKQYDNFFEQTDKKLHITLDPVDYNGRALVLTERDQTIGFDSLSDGEKNLFNLIISLATAVTNKPDLIIFDEPELFMHDDMIRTLVKEIKRLSDQLPNSSIIITTHSSVLIEELAGFGKEKLNLIAISNKEVFNSSNDIDFINVLKENGVSFSPLYLSKRPNIFIENKGEPGQKHKQFLLSFFDERNQPNIIPIGSSGQVKIHEDYADLIEKIIESPTRHTAIGVLDGDMWQIKNFKSYFNGELELRAFLKKLKGVKEFYISDATNQNLFYFNCWEIENLYFQDEILMQWKKKSDKKSLTKESMVYILKALKPKLIDSWIKTYQREILKPIYLNQSTEKYEQLLKERVSLVEEYQKTYDSDKEKLESFFDELLKNDLISWMPGKEIYTHIITEYDFDKNGREFSRLDIAKKIQVIIK